MALTPDHHPGGKKTKQWLKVYIWKLLHLSSEGGIIPPLCLSPLFSKLCHPPDNDGIGGRGLRLSFEHLKGKGGGRGLPKLNKCEQERRRDPNTGPCVIT